MVRIEDVLGTNKNQNLMSLNTLRLINHVVVLENNEIKHVVANIMIKRMLVLKSMRIVDGRISYASVPKGTTADTWGG